MSGNSFGTIFTLTSFGESHGPAIGGIVDGCPSGLSLSAEDIQSALDRRRPGTSRHVTQRREPDSVEILSGVFEGKTTGTPIGLLIRNVDAKSKDYQEIAEKFRPGHADYTYLQKYGRRDHRGGGRSSARETAVRVAAGAIAQKWLRETLKINLFGYLSALGEIDIPFQNFETISQNDFFAADSNLVPTLEKYLDDLRRRGDSCGAIVTVVAQGVPVGLGEPVYDRLDARIASAMMGINAVKGVEIGDGFASARQLGSVHGDAMYPQGFASNHAGGILGGISTGQPIIVRLAIKPTSSIRQERPTINHQGQATTIQTLGRHDPCVGIRAVPVAEAMLALVLMDMALLQMRFHSTLPPTPLTPL